MEYNLYDLLAPFLPFLAILISTVFNYYIIVKRRLSWQGILIANIVFLLVMAMFDLPAYDFLSGIVEFLIDLISQIIDLIFMVIFRIV